MEDIADADAVALGDAPDLAEDLRQLAPGDDAILGDDARGQSAGRANALLAGHPEPGAVFGRGGQADFAGIVLLADLPNAVGILIQAGVETVQLDDEHGLGV